MPGIRRGETVCDKAASASRRAEQRQAARRAAMDFLARREHSRHELRCKLQRKFPDHPAELIDDALERLARENLLCEQRFAENYIQSRKRKGYGYLYIRQALRERRVPEEVIASLLFSDDSDWERILASLIERRLSPGATLPFGGREHRRLLRFLESRGFSAAEISRALGSRLSRD